MKTWQLPRCLLPRVAEGISVFKYLASVCAGRDERVIARLSLLHQVCRNDSVDVADAYFLDKTKLKLKTSSYLVYIFFIGNKTEFTSLLLFYVFHQNVCYVFYVLF